MHDELLTLVNQRVNIGHLAGEPQVNSSEGALVFLINEDSIHQIGEIVSTGAIHRPLIRELLARFENLLDDRV